MNIESFWEEETELADDSAFLSIEGKSFGELDERSIVVVPASSIYRKQYKRLSGWGNTSASRPPPSRASN